MGIRRGSVAAQTGPDPASVGVAQVLRLARQEGSVRAAWQQHRNVDATAVAKALSELSGLPMMEDVDINLVQPEVVRPVPLAMAREVGLVPMYVVDGNLIVGIGELSALPHLDDLRVLLGHPVRPVLLPVDVLDNAINKAWDKAAQSAQAVLAEAGEDEEEDDDLFLDEDLLDDPNEAPIIRFVNALLTQAIKERASDIHIEPFEKELLVRFRVDGVMHNTIQPPNKYKDSIVARIKIMAGLNIAEKRLPQDGRIRRKHRRSRDRPAREHRASAPRRARRHAYPREGRGLRARRHRHERQRSWRRLARAHPASRTASCWCAVPPAPESRPRCTRPWPRSTAPT